MTDSACSLPPEIAAAQSIAIVPLWVTIGDQQYRDGEVGLLEVLRDQQERVSTSGPAPGEIESALEQVDNGDGAVVLTVSRRMSGVYNAARLAAAARLQQGKRCACVDTSTAAGAQGLVVLAAAKAARAGFDLDRVVSAAEAASDESKLLATLPSLAHLARSGRVPGAAAWGANWLGLNPVFEYRGARVWPLRPARGTSAACGRILAAFERDAARYGQASRVDGSRQRELPRPRLHVAALHASDADAAESLLAAIKDRWEPETAFVGAFSSAMVAHTGPGLVGVAWRWERAPER